MNQSLKYCSFRLFFSILLFFPFLIVLGGLNSETMRQFMGDDRPFILASFFVILLLVSVIISLIGKQQIAGNLDFLKRRQDIKVKEIIQTFEMLLALTYSAFFTPLSGERLRRGIIQYFADLLASESMDEHVSRKILEASVANGTATPKVEAALSRIYANREEFDDNELFCAETICLNNPEESILLEKIVDEYLYRSSTGIKARTIFRTALKMRSKRSVEIVSLLQKDYRGNGKIDELGAWVYLVISENRDKFDMDENWLQGRLSQAYAKYAQQKGELPKLLKAALEQKASVPERDITDQKITVAEKAELPKADEEIVLDEPESIDIAEPVAMGKPVEEATASFFQRLRKDFIRKESLPLYLTGAAVVVIILITFLTFSHEDSTPIVPISNDEELKAKEEVQTVAGKKAEEVSALHEKGKKEVVSDKPFTIQVAAYKKTSDANRYLAVMRKTEKDSYISLLQSTGDGTVYRVRIGFFGNQEEARSYATKLKEKGTINSFFISSFEGGVWALE